MSHPFRRRDEWPGRGFFSVRNAFAIPLHLTCVSHAACRCLAPPFIDDYAPDNLRGAWLALFYSAIPIGQAVGFVFGGKMNSSSLGWRGAFLLESFAMAPFTLVCFFATNRFKPRHNAVTSSSLSLPAENLSEPLLGDDRAESSSALSSVVGKPPALHHSPLQLVKRLFVDIGACLRTPMWTLATFGYASFTFTLGSFAYWGPTIVTKLFPDVSLDTADLAFGGVTAGTGLVGTAIGGLILDRLIKRDAIAPADGSLSKSGKTMLILFFSMCIGSPLLFCAFLMKSFSMMIALLAVGELFLFITTAPSNAVLLWCVPSDQRAFSMAFSVVVMHLFGDVPSPVFTGYLLQQYGTTPAVLTITAFLSFAILCWGGGFVYDYPLYYFRQLRHVCCVLSVAV
jgi:MFS transporter, Spinster family, sphingosine-1-phosphate transporter